LGLQGARPDSGSLAAMNLLIKIEFQALWDCENLRGALTETKIHRIRGLPGLNGNQ